MLGSESKRSGSLPRRSETQSQVCWGGKRGEKGAREQGKGATSWDRGGEGLTATNRAVPPSVQSPGGVAGVSLRQLNWNRGQPTLTHTCMVDLDEWEWTLELRPAPKPMPRRSACSLLASFILLTSRSW